MSPYRRTQAGPSGPIPLMPAVASGVQSGSTMPPFFAVVVLVTGVVGGLFFIIAVIVLCKYCVRNGAHLKITLCWLRRRNVGRFLGGQYGSLDCVATGSGIAPSGKSISSELTVGASGDDELGSPGGGGPSSASLGGWRRKHRQPQRQASTVQAIVTPPAAAPLDGGTPPINANFADNSSKAEHGYDIENMVAPQFKEFNGTCREQSQGNSSVHYSGSSGLDTRKKSVIATTSKSGKVLHTVSASDEIASDQVDTSQSVRRVSFVLNAVTTRSLTDGADSLSQRWPTNSGCPQSKSFGDVRMDRRSSSVAHHHGSSSPNIDKDMTSSSNSRANFLTPYSAVAAASSQAATAEGEYRRRLSLMPPGIMAARRSLPTPTTMTSSTAHFEGPRSASSTTNRTPGKSAEIEVDAEDHQKPDAGPLPAQVITSIRRRSYASAGSRGSSGGNASNNGGSTAMTHSKSIWLSPESCLASSQTDHSSHTSGDRRQLTSSARRASASFEITPTAHGKTTTSSCGTAPSKMQQRVRSCDADPGGGVRGHQRPSQTPATLATPPTARKSPPVSRHCPTDSEPSITATGNAASGGFATHTPKPTVTMSSTSTSVTTSPRATLKVRYPGISGNNIGRVPRYNDPGSFEEVNEDLLYNKHAFGDAEDTAAKKNLHTVVSRKPSSAAVDSIATADRRNVNTNESLLTTQVGSDATNRPASPSFLSGDSVQQQYRELWDLRATIAEQECLMAIRLEAASSPEPEKLDEDATSDKPYGIIGSHYSVSTSGDRLSLPISRRQIYRNVIERRLSQRQEDRCSVSGGLLPVSPVANCSVDSFETDGDVSNSDTSRHDITTTSFESSTTTTTTDNNTDCLSDARNSLETTSLYSKTGSGQCSAQRSPTTSLPMRTHLAETKVVSGLLTESQCSSSFDDTSSTNALTSSNCAENAHQSTSQTPQHQRVEPATNTTGSGSNATPRGQPSRSLPSCSSGCSTSTNRTAAKKRRDFRKCDRSDYLQVHGAHPAVAAIAKDGSVLSGVNDAVKQGTSDAGVLRDGREGDFRKPNTQLPSCFAPMKPLLANQRRAPSTVDSFRASISNWRYGRQSESSSGFRDYSVDERTNAVYNEFLRYDRSLDCGDFLHRPDRTGDSGQGVSYRQRSHHQHQRSHHHNPLHQHRWRHRVYCTTGSPASFDGTGFTSGCRAFVKSPVSPFSLERQYSQSPPLSSSLNASSSPGTRPTANTPRAATSALTGSATASLRRTPAGGGQSTVGTDGGLPLTTATTSEPTRRRPPPIQIIVVTSSQNQNSTSVDEDSPTPFIGVDRMTSSVTSTTH